MWYARNELPTFPGHKTPPAQKRAHNQRTHVAEIVMYACFEMVSLSGEVSGDISDNLLAFAEARVSGGSRLGLKSRLPEKDHACRVAAR